MRFWFVVGLTALALLPALICPADVRLLRVAAFSPLLLCGVAVGMFIWENRKLQRAAIEMTPSGEVGGIIPSLSGCRAQRIRLFSHQSSCGCGLVPAPELDAHPDAFSRALGYWRRTGPLVGKNGAGVYGPLVFGAELIVWMAVLNLASWYGARRSRMRSGMFHFVAILQCGLAFLFGSLAIGPVLHWPPAIPVLAIILVSIGGVVYFANAAAKPRDTTKSPRIRAGPAG